MGKKKEPYIPIKPEDIATNIDGFQRREMIEALGCSESTFMADRRALKEMGEEGIIDLDLEERSGYYSREEAAYLLLLRRETIIKGRKHALKSVGEYVPQKR